MIISPKIELRQTDAMGKGFFAKEDINIGQQIMSIDAELFISCERYQDFFEFSEIIFSNQISNKSLFAYFLATVNATPKNHPEEYKDILKYIAQLPKQLQGLVNWQYQQLDLLNNKQLVRKVKRKIQRIKSDFQIIKQNVQKIAKSHRQNWQYRLFKNSKQIQLVSFEQMKYFYSVIESRSVHDPCFLDVGALVPYLSPHCKVQCDLKNTVETIRKIKKDEQIFVNYGEYNNENFIQLYGFLPCVQQVIKQDEHYREKLAIQYNKIYRDAEISQKEEESVTKLVDYNPYN